LKGGVQHTFKNTGTVAATIVEVFGRKAAPAADAGTVASALAKAFSPEQ
jgi:hypothetical protein